MNPAVLRILDANLNRAREALRVLEDHARFVLDDAALAARTKLCRHQLAQASAPLPPGALLGARDVESDVGAQTSTEAEQRRTTPAEVAAAAAKRAAEALRALEEYAKLVSPPTAAAIKQLRYLVYSIEQDVLAVAPRRARLRQAQLHVLITESHCAGPWLRVCEQAIAGGADALQLREKELPDAELLKRARILRDLTRASDVLFAVNDRPDLARLAEADAVHVGQDDLSVADARRIAGPTMLVGKSTHSVEQARAAAEERPDYLGVGPMFPSPTKPSSPVEGLGLLRDAIALSDMPVIAIGGITVERVAELVAAGGRHIAVCQAVIAAGDPAEAARALKHAICRTA